jgi:molybdopterin-containing oxidoreductase family iron-sulfur binding subunit
MDRRGFVRIAGLSALGAAGVQALPKPGETAAPEAVAAAPPPVKRWAMAVDVSKCLAEKDCADCTSACHRAHNVPDIGNPKDEVKWIWKEPFKEALPDQHHEYMDERLQHAGVLVFCNHCDNPPCVRVCPTQATWKRNDGVVMMDWHRCIGCRYCVAACPYGSRSFNWRDPRPFIAELKPDFPSRSRGVVEKCNFCEERLAKGQPPACAEACKGKALIFGDLQDPDSPIREILRTRTALRRKPGLGTAPQVYYLVL